MKTLLQKAEKVKCMKRKVRDENQVLDLTLSWLNSKITVHQATRALGYKIVGGSTYYIFARSLQKAYKNGLIKITR